MAFLAKRLWTPPSPKKDVEDLPKLTKSKSECTTVELPPSSLAAGKASGRLQVVTSNHESSSGSLSARLASLASPCFFHSRFDDAVDINKVLEEIAADETMTHSKLMQTATGVREVSKQLQSRPIKRAVRNVMIITKARDNSLVHLTREMTEWLLRTPRYGSSTGVNVFVDHKLRKSKRFDYEQVISQDSRFEKMLSFWTPDLCWTSPEKFDLVITLGGDGTVLFTSWLFQRIVPPILSFSLGSLGFLTPFDFQRYTEHLDRVMGGLSGGRGIPTQPSLAPALAPKDTASDAGMRVNLRMRFTCTVFRSLHSKENPDAVEETSQFEVLNELVIDRGPSPYVSNLELFGDDQLLTVIQADGIIFSTPTGSTAYSLSAGGSLVHPDIPAILLTPICPHTLSFRPMLLNDTIALRVAVPRSSRATAYCSFDGKGRIELRQGDYVTISASKFPFPTVMGGKLEWIDSVSRTLRWNTREAQQKGWNSRGAKGSQQSRAPSHRASRLSGASFSSKRPEMLRAGRAESPVFWDGDDAEEEEEEDDEDEEFDIDFDDDEGVDSRDSGYGGETASSAGASAAAGSGPRII